MKLKSKLIKTLLISIFFINIFNSKVESQVYTDFTQGFATLSPDSLFYKFEYPKLPKYFYNDFKFSKYEKKYKISSFQLICKFLTDTSSSIRLPSLQIYPILDYGNNLPKNHKIWKSIIKSIKEVSKKWRVKKLYWYNQKSENNNLKANKIDLDPSQLPFGGQQSHLMIISIYPEFDFECSHCNSGNFNFIYNIQINE